jgi:hypothetical protein
MQPCSLRRRGNRAKPHNEAAPRKFRIIMITNRTPDKGAFATVLQFVFLFGLTPVAQAQTAEPNPAAGENLSGGAATGGNEL